MALTPKQEKFCLVYLETGNASEAYRQSYDAQSMKPETVNKRASELLDNGAIAGRLDELTKQATTSAVMTRTEAIEKLSLIADTALTDLLEFDQHEVETLDGPVRETIWRMKDSDGIAERAAVAIKSVTMTKFGPKIEMHDKLNAIQQLAKLQGWEAAQKFDHTSGGEKISAPMPLTKEALEYIAKKLEE